MKKLLLCIPIILLLTCKINSHNDYKYEIVDDVSLANYFNGTWICECFVYGDITHKRLYFDYENMTFTGRYYNDAGKELYYYQKIDNRIIYLKAIDNPDAQWQEEYKIMSFTTFTTMGKTYEAIDVEILSTATHNSYGADRDRFIKNITFEN